MAVKNYSSTNNRKYFSEFFNKGYIFPAILLALIFTTILAISYQFDVFSQLLDDNAKYFTIAFVGFYFACIIFYACISMKNDMVNTGDAVGFSFILTAILYFIFILAYENFSLNLSLLNIVLIACLFVFGLVITAINSVNYSYYQGDEIESKKTYFNSVSNKYHFFGLIICSLIINCLFYLILNLKHNFAFVFSGSDIDSSALFFDKMKSLVENNIIYLAILGVGAGFLAIYAIFSIFDRKINALDLFLTGYYINIPILVAMFLLLDNDKDGNTMKVLIPTVAVVVLTLFRFIFANKKVKADKERTFYKQLFCSKEVFKAIGISALVIGFTNIAIEMDILKVFVSGDEFHFYIALIPFALLCTACFMSFIAMAYGLMQSIFNLGSKKYEKQDRSVIYNFFFALFDLAIVIGIPFLVTKTNTLDIYSIVILASYMFISFGVMLMRRKATK